MAHPFEKMFLKALKSATEFDNPVLSEALKLKAKGYRGEEIATVLLGLEKGLIDKNEAAVITEALDEFRQFLPDVED